MNQLESLKKVYKVGSANWNMQILSHNEQEAASMGLQSILKINKKDTQLSFVISVEEDILNAELYLFETSMILANIGYFKLSEEIASLSDFFLDKGKNSH